MVRLSEVQAECPGLFKAPHRQDREALLCQQQDEPSRAGRRHVKQSAGLVAALRGQAKDGLRMRPGNASTAPHRPGARFQILWPRRHGRHAS